MQTITAQLDSAFRAAISTAFGLDADPLIGPSQNEKFGDYQSNAAMGLAKQLAERPGEKTNPRAVAEQIKAKLALGDMASDVSIAGPGFINVRLSPAWLAAQLSAAGRDERLGVEPVKRPRTVVVDYSGPNIAKQMHVGHLRSTIIGDAAARVLAFRGEHVIRQNHLGDWGTQFGKVVLAMWYEAVAAGVGAADELKALIEAQQQAGKQETALAGVASRLATFHSKLLQADEDGTRHFLPYLLSGNLDLEELERIYVFVSVTVDSAAAESQTIANPRTGKTNTLAEIPRLITVFIQNPQRPENRQEKLAWEKARQLTLDSCWQLYRRLNVQLADPSIQSEPLERGESAYNLFLPDVVRSLKEKGLAVESEGATVVNVPKFGTPLIIEKAGGGYLYGTTDLAAVRFRTQRLGASRILYFVDARQGQHFNQVFWTAKAAGWAENTSLEHAAFGTMLGPDGKPFKTRSGDTVKLKDLLDEAEERAFALVSERSPEIPEAQRRSIARAVGVGAVKYADLSKDRTSDYVFSFDQMLALEGNTAPYMQYAYARVRSIFRRAEERGVSYHGLQNVTFALEAPQELALAKQILRFGEIVEIVERELKPHVLCAYLYELAGRYSSFYEACPVLTSDEPVRSSRLALVDLTARTLAMGLNLLGIEHPEQM